MLLFLQLNRILFDNKLKLINKPKWLQKILPRVTISFFNMILCDDIKKIEPFTLLHELSHTIERCNYSKYKFKISILKTIKFYVAYMFPQILTLGVLLSFLNLWFLLFMLFLIPNPYLSEYRKNVELRGYFWNWYLKCEYDYPQIFNGWLYLKMDVKHNDLYYQNEFRKILDEMAFSNNDDESFKMFVIMREYVKLK